MHTGPILFACLGSSFGPLLGLKVAKLWLLYRSFFGKFWCQILVSSWRQLALVHNWKVVKNIPWPWDLFLNFLFLFLCILLYCIWREIFYKFLILNYLVENKFSLEGYFQIKVLFKIGMVLLLINFYMDFFLKFCEKI